MSEKSTLMLHNDAPAFLEMMAGSEQGKLFELATTRLGIAEAMTTRSLFLVMWSHDITLSSSSSRTEIDRSG